MVKLLIDEFSADIHHSLDRNGVNCFQYAIIGGNLEIIRYLHSLDENSCKEKDNKGETVLNYASLYSTQEVTEFLIDEIKLDINETGRFGRNCFLSAVEAGNYETMVYLHGLDNSLCRQNDEDNVGAINLAIKYYNAPCQKDFRIFEFLLKECNL